jgi:DNA-binding protein H-NS
MLNNFERQSQIQALRTELKTELANLERRYKEDAAALERNCRQRITAIEREISANAAQEIREAREAIRRVLESCSVDAAVVLASLPTQPNRAAGSAPRKMRASTVLHHGPDGKCWNGRGRVPLWFKAAQLSSGAATAPSH